jgi:plastocyanin
MNRFSLAAAGTAVLLTLAACSSSGGGNTPGTSAPGTGAAASTAAPPAASGPQITIENFGYSGTLTVKAGAKVNVVNKDSVPHTVTDKTGKFDTGTIQGSGGTGSFTAPTKPGKYAFGCTIHPTMAGTLTVTA